MFIYRYVTLGQICDQEKVQKEKKNLKIFEMKVKIFRFREKRPALSLDDKRQFRA